MSSTESLEHRELGRLYRDHHGWLRGWLLRRLNVPAEAADLAQDTFLRLLASPASMAQLQGVRQDVYKRQASIRARWTARWSGSCG